MVSIIIPAYNEDNKIESLLSEISGIAGEKEIIVVDGGSVDDTASIASKYATVISSPKGRANQMNAGAHIASGDILWFVHCDSKVHLESLKAINTSIATGHVGGGFNLEFYDYPSLFFKYLSVTSNWRAKYLKLIFGDQGLFVKRDVFEKLGGFAPMPLMEDWDLSVRLRKTGKLDMIKLPIYTSARRFVDSGILKTHLHMHKIKLLYILGTPAEELSKAYHDIR